MLANKIPRGKPQGIFSVRFRSARSKFSRATKGGELRFSPFGYPHRLVTRQAAWYTVNKNLLFSLLGLCILSFTPLAKADDLTHNFRAWEKIDFSGPLGSTGSVWRYNSNYEQRNLETRVDSSIGYFPSSILSMWSGFIWVTPNNGSGQEYRPWQQLIYKPINRDTFQVQIRNRLEQRKQEGQPEWSLRLRERVTAYWPGKIARVYTPVIYDEVFFNLNQPSWVTQNIIDLNRLFIGLDILGGKYSYLEAGYINQFKIRTPANLMDHIISFTLVFVFP